jgi:hypothetical protein
MRKRYTTKQSGKNEKKKHISQGKEKELDLRLRASKLHLLRYFSFFSQVKCHTSLRTFETCKYRGTLLEICQGL